MSRIKNFKIKVIGLIVSFSIFGCFYGGFCSATSQTVNNKGVATQNNNVNNNVNNTSEQIKNVLTGGISYRGTRGVKGVKARDLSEKEVVQIAVFMYALSKNYIREFGFKEENAKGFIEGFLKSLASDLSRDGFSLEIKDMVSSDVTKEQLEAVERMNVTRNFDNVKVKKKEFDKVKAEVLEIAKNCCKNNKKDKKIVDNVNKKGKEGILKFGKEEVLKKIEDLKKQGLIEDNAKIKKMKKLLKNKVALKKHADLILKRKIKVVDSLDERLEEIKKLKYSDIKAFNDKLDFNYTKTQDKQVVNKK